MIPSLSAVIRYFYVVRVAVNKAKTDPPLKVDGNRELSLAIPSQCMNTGAVKSFQVIQTSCDVQILQTSLRTFPHVCRKPFRLPGCVQLLRVPVSKRLDHVSTVIFHVTRVNTGCRHTERRLSRRRRRRPAASSDCYERRAHSDWSTALSASINRSFSGDRKSVV